MTRLPLDRVVYFFHCFLSNISDDSLGLADKRRPYFLVSEFLVRSRAIDPRLAIEIGEIPGAYGDLFRSQPRIILNEFGDVIVDSEKQKRGRIRSYHQ